MKWLRSILKGHQLVKDMTTLESAIRVVNLGADAIIVSNSGGRQQYPTTSLISPLSAIAATLGK